MRAEAGSARDEPLLSDLLMRKALFPASGALPLNGLGSDVSVFGNRDLIKGA
ncbi:hypothetical protein SAMN05444714_3278 [Yoonia litorea]|uniref:Uncharacterized protein n=1 Tax=Yoonia litorea TaxID=1123755 RepID=A0A1I6N3C2_9RHOB|nr:hypothetical protein SAMN05444714_3278 [Yoonia litorea]